MHLGWRGDLGSLTAGRAMAGGSSDGAVHGLKKERIKGTQNTL
jgi:hypothetical protein